MFGINQLHEPPPPRWGQNSAVGLTAEEELNQKQERDRLARAGGAAFWVGGALGALITWAIMK